MEKDKNCLFCQIIEGKEPGVKVWESSEFLAIKNKYPKAPIDVLVMPKEHWKKKILREFDSSQFDVKWSKMMKAVFQVVKLLGLDKTGYKLTNFGAGYNHFEHEHVHVLGGSKEVPVE